MKKAIRNWLLVCMVLLVCSLTLVACESDNDVPPSNDSISDTITENDTLNGASGSAVEDTTEEIPHDETEEHRHSFGDWTVTQEATCTENGIQERTCVCGEKEEQSVAAVGHIFGQWDIVQDATCTEGGMQERSCSCGEKETKNISATGHTFSQWTTIQDATCTQSGEKERACSCGEKETQSVAQLPHTFGKWTVTKKASCTQAGEQERTCICGEKETKTIECLPHTEVIDKAVTPTCAAPGKTEGKHCSVCGEILVAQQELTVPHDAPYGICIKCSKVADRELAARHYFEVDVSEVRGETYTCYYNGSIYARYRIDEIDYSVDISNAYDGRICVRLSFEINCDVIKQGEYYDQTAFLKYTILDGNRTIKSGSVEVYRGNCEISYTLFYSYAQEYEICLNLNDYYM